MRLASCRLSSLVWLLEEELLPTIGRFGCKLRARGELLMLHGVDKSWLCVCARERCAEELLLLCVAEPVDINEEDLRIESKNEKPRRAGCSSGLQRVNAALQPWEWVTHSAKLAACFLVSASLKD